MSVIPITLFFSLLLAGIFVWLFAREQQRRRFASSERDSLLPLADETPRLAHATDDHDHGTAPEHDHDLAHTHGKGSCGCKSGVRPPCSGCRRHTGATPLSASTPLS